MSGRLSTIGKALRMGNCVVKNADIQILFGPACASAGGSACDAVRYV